jgi:hypothetical protein
VANIFETILEFMKVHHFFLHYYTPSVLNYMMVWHFLDS